MNRRAARGAALLGAVAALLSVELADAAAPTPRRPAARTAAPPKKPARPRKATTAQRRVAETPTETSTETSTESETETPMSSPTTSARPEAEVDAPPAPSLTVTGDAAGALAGSEKALELSGRAYTHLRVPLALGGAVQHASTSLRLDAHARMTKDTFAAVSGVVDALHPDANGDSEVRGRLREAYAGAHAAGFELRAGQQILSWGNADGVHAVDLLGAQDYAFYSVTTDAQKLGAPSVLVSFKPDDGTSPLEVTVVWQPMMPASRVLVPSGAIPPQVRLLAEERPRAIFDSEGAIKIGWAPGGWDVALIGFHGFNHLSEPYLARIAAGAANVGRRFQSYEAVGLQASVALDAWVLRIESAYVVTANDSGKDRLRQPSHLDAIVGAERPLGERVRASVQGVVRHHPMYLPLDAPYAGSAEVAEATRQIAQVNARVQNYTHQTRPGASLALAYTAEDESFEASIVGLAYVVGFDWVVQPMVGYRPTELLKLDVGAQIFGGQRSSLGFLSSQSGLFAQATASF